MKENTEWTYENRFNNKVTSYVVQDENTNKIKNNFAFRTAESFLSNITASKGTNIDLSQYKMGQTIYHKKFGEGIITEIATEGDDLKLDISFEKVGHKRLMAKYANLEIRN